jgi:hypothetical protein
MAGMGESKAASQQPEPQQPEPEQALSALERALRDALAAAGPREVVQAITTVLSADGAPSGDIQAAPPPAELDPDQFHGRVQKVSVSMPEELSLAIRERTGPGGFSRYISDAAEKRLRNELLGEYLDELDRIHGPVPRELLDWAGRQWPDYEEE